MISLLTHKLSHTIFYLFVTCHQKVLELLVSYDLRRVLITFRGADIKFPNLRYRSHLNLVNTKFMINVSSNGLPFVILGTSWDYLMMEFIHRLFNLLNIDKMINTYIKVHTKIQLITKKIIT